ncbi:MAG: hypothetical protein GY944_11770 [bacterium]|nr:hypothetical protein [bacterium]
MFSALAVLGVAVFVAVVQANVYRSDAELLLRGGRDSIGADPTVAVGDTVHVTEMRAQQVRSDIEAMRSVALVEATVAAIGADEVLSALHADLPPGRLGQMLIDFGLRAAPPSDSQPRAVAAVSARLGIAAVRDTNNVSLTFEAPTAAFAQRFLKTFVEQLRIWHLTVHRATDSQDFFSSQMMTQQQELKTAEDRQRRYRNESGASTLAARRDLAVQRSGELRTALLAADTVVAASAERFARLCAASGKQPATLKTARTEAVPSQGVSLVRNRLVDLQQLQHLIIDEDSQLAGHRARAKTLRMQLGVSDQRVAKLDAAFNDSVVALDQLARQVVRRADTLRRYTDVFEQARLQRELDAQHLSSIRVIEPATLPAVPLRPDRLMILGLGVLLAAFAAALIALVSHAANDGLCRPADVEARLGLPVLAALPRSRHAGRRARVHA